MGERQKRAIGVAVLVVVGFVACMVRAWQPVSRPAQWLERSRAFTGAISHGDWERTYQQYHPGVTVMAIGGAGVRLYQWTRGTAAEAIFSWAVSPFATPHGREMAAGVLALSVAHAAMIVAIAVCLAALGGWTLGITAGWLLTFSPAVLAGSRVFHPDGLVAALMMLSVLLALVALQGRRRAWVLSGLFAGLATLTKTPAFFLAPFAALSLLVGRQHTWLRRETGAIRISSGLAGALLVWAAAVALAWGLWPALWVDPVRVAKTLYEAAVTHALEPHTKPIFFFGELHRDETPGLLFYPVNLLLRSSFVTLAGVVVALVLYGTRRSRVPVTRECFWLLVAYVGLFTAVMALGAKQTGWRYVAPAQVGLEVLAAIGLVGLATRVASTRQIRPWYRSMIAAAVVLSAALLQATTALAFAPDYGAHFNPLFGGARAATRIVEPSDQNEGIQAIGEFLGRERGAEQRSVAVHWRSVGSLRQFFHGQIVEQADAPTDFLLLDRTSLQRGLANPQWRQAAEDFAKRPADLSVVIDGVELYALYRRSADLPPQGLIVRRDPLYGPWIAWSWTALIALLLARSSRALLATRISPLRVETPTGPSEDHEGPKPKVRVSSAGR